jgi:hypothetical protein
VTPRQILCTGGARFLRRYYSGIGPGFGDLLLSLQQFGTILLGCKFSLTL